MISDVMLEYDIILYSPGMSICILLHTVFYFSSRDVIPIFKILLNMAVISMNECLRNNDITTMVVMYIWSNSC